MVQSKRFLNDPGSAPAYSGVDKSDRVGGPDLGSQVGDGTGERIAVVVGVEVRQAADALIEHVPPLLGRAAAAVRSAAVLVDRPLRLPDTSSTRTVRSMPGSTSMPGTNFPAVGDLSSEGPTKWPEYRSSYEEFTEPVGFTRLRNLHEVTEDAHTFFNRGIFIESTGQETDDRVRWAGHHDIWRVGGA